MPISPSERWTFRCCGSCTGALSPSLVASSHDCPWYEKTFGGSRKRSGGILASYGDITVFFSCLTVGYPTSNEAGSKPSRGGILFFGPGRPSPEPAFRRCPSARAPAPSLAMGDPAGTRSPHCTCWGGRCRRRRVGRGLGRAPRYSIECPNGRWWRRCRAGSAHARHQPHAATALGGSRSGAPRMPVVSAPTFRWIALLPHAWRVRAARCHAVGAPRRSGARYRFMHPPQGRAPASQT